METYFWPGEDFNQRRHVLITSCLVFSAMLGDFFLFSSSSLPNSLPLLSLPHHLRPRPHPRARRRILGHRARVHLPSVPLSFPRQFADCVFKPSRSLLPLAERQRTKAGIHALCSLDVRSFWRMCDAAEHGPVCLKGAVRDEPQVLLVKHEGLCIALSRCEGHCLRRRSSVSGDGGRPTNAVEAALLSLGERPSPDCTSSTDCGWRYKLSCRLEEASGPKRVPVGLGPCGLRSDVTRTVLRLLS